MAHEQFVGALCRHAVLQLSDADLSRRHQRKGRGDFDRSIAAVRSVDELQPHVVENVGDGESPLAAPSISWRRPIIASWRQIIASWSPRMDSRSPPRVAEAVVPDRHVLTGDPPEAGQ